MSQYWLISQTGHTTLLLYYYYAILLYVASPPPWILLSQMPGYFFSTALLLSLYSISSYCLETIKYIHKIWHIVNLYLYFEGRNENQLSKDEFWLSCCMYLDSLRNLLLVFTITYLVFDSDLTAVFASLFLDIMKLQTLYKKVIIVNMKLRFQSQNRN